MKQLTEASGNSLMGGILSSAICSVGLFNCLQYMSVHTTQSKGSRLRVAAGPLKDMCEMSDRTGPPELEGPQIVLSRFIADSRLEQ